MMEANSDETHEVVGPLDGRGLECVIEQVCGEGWLIVKVEWEDLGDQGMSARWKAHFKRRKQN